MNWSHGRRTHRRPDPSGTVCHGTTAGALLLRAGTGQARHRLMRRRSHDEQRSWRYLDIINRMIDRPGGRTHRVILLGLFSTLYRRKGRCARIGTRARCCWWKIRKRGSTRLCFPWRGIFLICCRCSESPPRIPESCSLTPVEYVCRPVRESSRVTAYRLGPGGLNAEDGRRIAFHIRFNRASSLFARCWLLVEGETETG